MHGTSPWHVSALQVVGLESMTISSRLRKSSGGRGMLQDLEDTINNTGKRRIAKLEMSIADSMMLSDNGSNEPCKAKQSCSITPPLASEGDEQLSNFDIDVFTREYRVSLKTGRKEHVFGRVEVSRGNWSLPEDDEVRDPRDRFYQGPILQR
jgi:hypothetical protein